ncbi:hypothetical protein LINPERPRIM_LOCUS298 [Linum perenne]
MSFRSNAQQEEAALTSKPDGAQNVHIQRMRHPDARNAPVMCRHLGT